jgi:1-acyl-sn-glycerol-3-phosphate acyltransferase
MRLVRRVVLAPAVVVLTTLLVVGLPLWLIAAAALSPVVPGRLRPLRLLWILILHLVLESLMLVEMFGLWIASGFGLFLRRPFFERIHYDIAQAYLVIFFREARRVLRLQIVTEGPAPDAFPGEPLLVCSRHAGPGDSFTVMYALMAWYHREPRVVLKDTMAWDPAIDVLLHRVPSRFISPNPKAGVDLESQVAELASNLDANDAFVIFPEGGNFTPERRRRAIDKLRRLGLESMARRAEGMENVLAPRPGGFLAALDAAPEADVVMVAHTGLDHLVTVADLWRELPMDKQLVMRWWRVPREQIPAGRDERIDWLFTWWEGIDRWVEDHRPVELPRRTRRG